MLTPIDVTGYSFDEFVRFLFDRPVPETPWWHTDWMVCSSGVTGGISHTVGDGAKLLRHLIQLFETAGTLPETYSDAQIEQGLWFISVMDGLDPPLWDHNLPLALRRQCVLAMEHLFAQLFSQHPLETASLMWWYNFAKGYDLDEGQTADEDDAAIQRAMFDTIRRVLYIDCARCRESALAGLGALKHPDTPGAIAEFLAANPELDDDLRNEFRQLRTRALERMGRRNQGDP